MSEIKLKEEEYFSDNTGTYPDVDENNNSFNRPSFSFNNNKDEKQYWQLNKTDSANLLIQKSDGVYVEEDDVTYLVEANKVDEYVTRLSFAWRNATETIDVPSEWWDDVKIVPKNSAMWDEVYVDKEIVKIDYFCWCYNSRKNRNGSINY